MCSKSPSSSTTICLRTERTISIVSVDLGVMQGRVWRSASCYLKTCSTCETSRSSMPHRSRRCLKTSIAPYTVLLKIDPSINSNPQASFIYYCMDIYMDIIICCVWLLLTRIMLSPIIMFLLYNNFELRVE